VQLACFLAVKLENKFMKLFLIIVAAILVAMIAWRFSRLIIVIVLGVIADCLRVLFFPLRVFLKTLRRASQSRWYSTPTNWNKIPYKGIGNKKLW